MAKELVYFERTFRHLFCQYGNPYYNNEEKKISHSANVNRALEEMDIYASDNFEQDWLECLCSPKYYSLNISGLTRFLNDFELLDHDDVKGHAKLVSILSCTSSRQSLGFGTSRTHREYSIFPRLHRAKQIVLVDVHDDERRFDGKLDNSRTVRVGRGWGPPPNIAGKIREL